jgi:hypothetical protein
MKKVKREHGKWITGSRWKEGSREGRKEEGNKERKEEGREEGGRAEERKETSSACFSS